MFNKTELRKQVVFGEVLCCGVLQDNSVDLCSARGHGPYCSVEKSKSIAHIPSNTLMKGGATFLGSRKEPQI